MADNSLLDEIGLSIKSDSESATQSIDNVVNSLQKLMEILGMDVHSKAMEQASEQAKKAAESAKEAQESVEKTARKASGGRNKDMEFKAKLNTDQVKAEIEKIRKEFGNAVSEKYTNANGKVNRFTGAEALSKEYDRLIEKERKFVEGGINTNGQYASFKILEQNIQSVINLLDKLQSEYRQTSGEAESLDDIIKRATAWRTNSTQAQTEDYFYARKPSGMPDGVAQGIKDATDSASSFEEVCDRIRSKFADAFSFDFSNLKTKDLDKEIQKTSALLDKLFDKESKMGALDTTEDSKALVSLEYDIERTLQKLDALRQAKANVGNSSVDSPRADSSPSTPSVPSSGGFTSSIKEAYGAFGKLRASIFGSKGAVNSFTNSLGGGLKTVLKYAFGIRSLFFLMNRIRRAFKEGSTSLARYSSEYRSSLSSMASSMGYLKGSMATAFAPIINYVASAMNSIIDAIASGLNTIGQLLASLTGKGFAVQAKKISAGLDGIGGAAGGAAKGAKALNEELSLMNFDELNQLTDNKSSGGGGGGGGGGASGGAQVAFETVGIDQGVSDFAELLKKSWENADFTEVGNIVGEKLKSAFDYVNDNSDGIKAKIEQLVKSIATFLNGVIGTEGLFASAGQLFANGINFILDAGVTFIETFDYGKFGHALSEGVTRAFDTIEWANAGRVLSDILISALDFAIGLIEGAEMDKVGDRLQTAIGGIVEGFRWSDLADKIFEFLKTALIGAVEMLIGKKIKEINLADIFKFSLSLGGGGFDLQGEIDKLVGKDQKQIDIVVNLIKRTWRTVKDWIGKIPNIEQGVELVKKKWSTVAKWIGSIPVIQQGVSLVKKGWSSVSSFIGSIPIVSATVNLVKGNFKSLADFIGSFAKTIHVTVVWETVGGLMGKVMEFLFGKAQKPSIRFAARGGILNAAQFVSPNVVAGEAGAEALVPLERPSSLKMIADAITDNMSVGSVRDMVAEGMTYAMAMNGSQNNRPIVVNAVLKTENNEVLARAVAKGNQSMNYRLAGA